MLGEKPLLGLSPIGARVTKATAASSNQASTGIRRMGRRGSGSDGVAPGLGRENRQDDDPAIKENRPVVDVVKIVPGAAFDLLERRGLAAKAVDLGPAGDAGLDALAM